MLTRELEYELPIDRIAVSPADPRDAAKLMVIDRAKDRIMHRHVRDLPTLVRPPRSATPSHEPGDLLVFNESRVIPASFSAVRAATGGRVTGLYLGQIGDDQDSCWRVMLESGGKLRTAEALELEPRSRLELVEKRPDGSWIAALDSPDGPLAVLERIGSTPLPPYIRRRRRDLSQQEIQPLDPQRYNTVYATKPGSVAAPTAGLHFTPALLNELDHTGVCRAMVTLHIGPGTFSPVRSDRLEDHAIHREWVHIPAATIASIHRAKATGRRIIPVGTTSVRALESLPDPLPAEGDFTTDTQLFIKPTGHGRGPVNTPDAQNMVGQGPFPFRFTDGLMTNFHLPRSTLLALVAALPGVGIDRLKTWYRIAIEQGYRFYSYGDAMLIL